MIHYKEKELENGLKLVVNQDKMTELVAINLLYKVGSKDEQENHTGFAHLFEHLMFSGSTNYNDFDTLINSLGGESNAFTNNDFTNFYITVPKIYLNTVLDIEKDRMRNLLIDENHLSVQKKVVTEEFKQRYLNQPYGDLYKEIRELTYKVHPYKWQTIGKDISHIESASLAIVRQFYDTYYQPNNVVLSISGNVETEKVIEIVGDMFSFSLNNPIIKRNYLQEPLQNENREKTIYRDVPSNLIVITFPMSERKNKDYYVYDLMSDILSNGKSSRLYNSLVVEKKKFTAIDAVVSGDDDKGMFMILGKYADDTDIKEGEKLIWQELENLINNPSSEDEFMKVKNKNISTTTFNNIKILDKAMNLAYYYHLDMLENINKDKDNYKQVTINDITTLAKRTFFEGKHNTLYYLAQK